MIPVVMNQEGVDLQTAVDFVGNMCKQSIDRFNEERNRLPSWGEKIDRDVDIYVDGLANWIVGSLHWSFESERYFGKNGRQVKQSRTVELLPRRLWRTSRHRESFWSRPSLLSENTDFDQLVPLSFSALFMAAVVRSWRCPAWHSNFSLRHHSGPQPSIGVSTFLFHLYPLSKHCITTTLDFLEPLRPSFSTTLPLIR